MQMCIFAGCDFLKALPGIGMAKAHGNMRKLKSFDKVRAGDLRAMCCWLTSGPVRPSGHASCTLVRQLTDGTGQSTLPWPQIMDGCRRRCAGACAWPELPCPGRMRRPSSERFGRSTTSACTIPGQRPWCTCARCPSEAWTPPACLMALGLGSRACWTFWALRCRTTPVARSLKVRAPAGAESSQRAGRPGRHVNAQAGSTQSRATPSASQPACRCSPWPSTQAGSAGRPLAKVSLLARTKRKVLPAHHMHVSPSITAWPTADVLSAACRA